MRLIDADTLMKTLKISDDCKHCEQCEYDYFCSMSGDFVSACEAINDAPSIDIVRCRECKYWIDNLTEDDTDEAYGECCFDWDIKMPKADDFCSYGERKESE